MGALPYALISLADKARFGGAAASDAETAKRLAAQCQGSLAPTIARLVGGLATHDPEVLSTVATDCQSKTQDLYAAEAALVAASEFDKLGGRVPHSRPARPPPTVSRAAGR